MHLQQLLLLPVMLMHQPMLMLLIPPLKTDEQIPRQNSSSSP